MGSVARPQGAEEPAVSAWCPAHRSRCPVRPVPRSSGPSTHVPSAWRAGGPVSMVTRSHFPSPGCSRQLSGGGCSRCPEPMGDGQRWAPLSRRGHTPPFQPSWGCHRPPCPTLCVLGLSPGWPQCLTPILPPGAVRGAGVCHVPCPGVFGWGDPGSTVRWGTRCQYLPHVLLGAPRDLCPGSSQCHGASHSPQSHQRAGARGWARPHRASTSPPATAAPGPSAPTAASLSPSSSQGCLLPFRIIFCSRR